MRTHVIRLLAILAAAVPLTAHAQIAVRSAPRMELGGVLEYAQPVSQFRQNVNHGFGGGGHFLYGIDRDRVFSLRVDAHYINYGNDTHYYVLNSVFQRVELQEKTSNNILILTIGPQLTVPSGPIRPYVNGGIGLGYFYTQTSLNGNDGYSGNITLAQNTNYSDNSLVYTGGAGVYIPVSILTLDVGANYNTAGRTRYLTKGDIVQDPNDPNNIIVTPRETDARFLTYHLGLAFNF